MRTGQVESTLGSVQQMLDVYRSVAQSPPRAQAEQTMVLLHVVAAAVDPHGSDSWAKQLDGNTLWHPGWGHREPCAPPHFGCCHMVYVYRLVMGMQCLAFGPAVNDKCVGVSRETTRCHCCKAHSPQGSTHARMPQRHICAERFCHVWFLAKATRIAEGPCCMHCVP